MILLIPKKLKKIILLMAIFTVFLSLSIPSLEAGNCEIAFGSCWFDYIWIPDFAVVYCGIGYIFCKKYIAR